MKKTIENLLLICFLVLSFQLEAQTKDSIKTLVDTSFVLGYIADDTYAGDTISDYCSVGYDKSLPSGSVVFISGVRQCKQTYSTQDFFEIYYRDKKYYIEKEKVSLDGYTFNDFTKLSTEQAVSFREKSALISTTLYLKRLNEVFAFLKSCKTKGLAIIKWRYYDESEYTEGTSFDITVYNPTGKTIKYLWFNVVGYNAVGDRVVDYRTKSSLLTRKAIGPIEKEGSGSYEFSYVWMTDIVEKVKIVSIRVQYMDGTEKIISLPSSIMLTEKQRKLLNDED